MTKVCIVGGVAGGTTTTTRLRQLDEQAQIILIKRRAYIPYTNCGLPCYIGGASRERDRLLVQAPQAFARRFLTEVRVSSERYNYSQGDALIFQYPPSGRPLLSYLSGPAKKKTRIVADNIAFGNRQRYKGAISTAIAKVFDITAAPTGVSEKTLRAEKIPYFSSITHSAAHAGYHPNARPISLEIVLSPEHGNLFGAQLVRRRMKSLKIGSLEQMLASAVASGVQSVACQMSMDVMAA